MNNETRSRSLSALSVPQAEPGAHPLLVGMKPLKVIVVDDDFGSLKWYSKLLMRDPRTTVRKELNNPLKIYPLLGANQLPDAVLLDIETPISHQSLKDLFQSLLTPDQNIAILCMSNASDPRNLNLTLDSGASAYLLKAELGMGIATAVTLAYKKWFLVTRSVQQFLKTAKSSINKPIAVLSWQPHPLLTPALKQSFELRVMYRMRSALAALEIYKTPQTIEKYINLCYARLADRQVDGAGLEYINWANLSPEERAFVLYTQPGVRELC